MRKFLVRHSLVLFLVVLLGKGMLGMLMVKGVQIINPTLSIQKDLGWLVMVIYAAFTLIVVKWVKIDKKIGLSIPPTAREWLVWTPGLIIPLSIWMILGFHSTWGHVPLLLIAAIGVAMNEEILFRGILLRALLPFGKIVAIFIPSLLFGASHLGNIFVGGNVTFGLFQFAWTTLAGMAFTAIRLQNKSLLPAIGFHFIMDATEYAVTGEYGVHNIPFSLGSLEFFVLLNLVFLLYSLYTLYKKSNVMVDKEAAFFK